MMWDGTMSGWAWLMMLPWLLFSVALLVLVVLAVVWLARNLGSGSPRGGEPGASPQPGSRSAREELDVRYARGELTREEYVQARRDLEGAT